MYAARYFGHRSKITELLKSHHHLFYWSTHRVLKSYYSQLVIRICNVVPHPPFPSPPFTSLISIHFSLQKEAPSVSSMLTLYPRVPCDSIRQSTGNGGFTLVNPLYCLDGLRLRGKSYSIFRYLLNTLAISLKMWWKWKILMIHKIKMLNSEWNRFFFSFYFCKEHLKNFSYIYSENMSNEWSGQASGDIQIYKYNQGMPCPAYKLHV